MKGLVRYIKIKLSINQVLLTSLPSSHLLGPGPLNTTINYPVNLGIHRGELRAMIG